MGRMGSEKHGRNPVAEVQSIVILEPNSTLAPSPRWSQGRTEGMKWEEIATYYSLWSVRRSGIHVQSV